MYAFSRNVAVIIQKKRPYRFFLAMCAIFVLISGTELSLARTARADAASDGPVSLKTRFIEQFIYFVEWPDTDSDVFVLGVLGNSALGKELVSLDGRPLLARGRTIEVKHFGSFAPEDRIELCDMLYIPYAERDNLWHIRRKLDGRSVLTVGDWPNFIRERGMINMTIVNEDLRWEINHSQMLKSGLKADAQLLRNAVRVVTVESELFGR